MSEREHQGGQQTRTLEMRVAELENKLASLTGGAPGAHQTAAATPALTSIFCYCYCYCQPIERVRVIYQQQAQSSPGPVAPFVGGFGSFGN